MRPDSESTPCFEKGQVWYLINASSRPRLPRASWIVGNEDFFVGYGDFLALP